MFSCQGYKNRLSIILRFGYSQAFVLISLFYIMTRSEGHLESQIPGKLSN